MLEFIGSKQPVGKGEACNKTNDVDTILAPPHLRGYCSFWSFDHWVVYLVFDIRF